MRGAAAVAAAVATWLVVAPRIMSSPVTLPSPPSAVRVLAAGLTGFTTFALSLGIHAVPAVAVALGLMATITPATVRARRRSQRVRRVAESWPDVLALVRSHLAAGDPLPDALVGALRRVDGPLRDHGLELERRLRVGMGIQPALETLRAELDDAVADRVLLTLGAAHETGGRRVGESLAMLSASIADELRLRAAHHAATTEQRLTAAVALLAPWALLVVTVATNPQAAASYRTPAGTVVIAIGFIATFAGYTLARRTVRLRRAPRVFR